MAQIEINCIGQTAIYTNTPEIFSGDVNIDKVKFTFDEAWNGYDMKTAVFYNNPKDTYPVMLDENNVAVIPEEVMADKCKLSIGVFGTNSNGDVKTSKILTYNIGKGAISNDLEATTPPEFWEQLLTRQINFENNIDGRVSTLETDVDTVEAIAKGRNQALAYNGYSEMITALNNMSADELNRGQNIYIATLGVPDLWVYGVEETNVEYTYVDDDTFVEGLNVNTTVQVGYYKLAQLETQKVDVGGITNDINTLKNDVDTLESGIASERLLWNVSDITKWDMTELTNMPTTSNIFSEMLYYDGKIYISSYGSSGALLHIYDGESWSSIQVWSGTSGWNITTSRIELEEFKGDIYISIQPGTGGQALILLKYDVNTKTASQVNVVSWESGIQISGSLCKNKEGTMLYWVGIKNKSGSQQLQLTTYDDSGSKTYNPLHQASMTIKGAYVDEDDRLCVLCAISGVYAYYVFSNEDLNSQLLGKNNYTSLLEITHSRYISNRLYCINDIACELHEVQYGLNSNCVHNQYFKGISEYENGEVLLLEASNVIYRAKRYREATSYAPKGTKIISTNSFAISDNLEAIDNGFLVTESGEVKIGIYE